MMAWKDKGCAICRRQWMSGERPEQLAVCIALHTRLYRCAECGSYWEENERYADVITKAAVISNYPCVIAKEND
jgi:uncharacterized Zn finger protein